MVKENCSGNATLTREEKLFGLSMLWKEASYNFAFFDQVPHLNWDEWYKAAISRIEKTDSDWEYYRELEYFFSALEDGHTRVLPSAMLRKEFQCFTERFLRTRIVENRVFVSSVTDEALRASGLCEYCEILNVNSTPIHEYVTRFVTPYICASTQENKRYQSYGIFLLAGPKDDMPVLRFRDQQGTIKECKVKRHPFLIEEGIFDTKPLEYIEISRGIGYLKVNNFFSKERFVNCYEEIHPNIIGTDGLIIDVRENWGGSTELVVYLLKHFTKDPIQSVRWKSPMNVAALKSWNKNIDWYEADPGVIDPYDGKDIYLQPINVIMDESTFSGAEDFCALFDSMDRGNLIGQNTAGSTGNPLMIELPGEGQAMICSKRDYYPDGTEFVGVGVRPDIEIRVTANAFQNGEDEPLSTALHDHMGEHNI